MTVNNTHSIVEIRNQTPQLGDYDVFIRHFVLRSETISKAFFVGLNLFQFLLGEVVVS